MTPAPFYDDVARAPAVTGCAWLTASDGVRIRAAHWTDGKRGTVLLFPGRTEYIEKYGPAAGELAARGYAMATLDWRGQGIADRLLEDRAPGHVDAFSDYNRDVEAFLTYVRRVGLPEPYYLIGHSMGGCIGLRALHRGLPVRAVAFSAPMWGIKMPDLMKPLAFVVTTLAPRLGHGDRLVPTTSPITYVLDAPFEDNLLTRDPEMHAFMREQLIAHPDLAIGGPTIQWLRGALRETAGLARLPSPDLPCLTVLGAQERIVDIPAIRERMARWPGSDFVEIEGAEHELMMESAPIRRDFYDRACALFAKNAG